MNCPQCGAAVADGATFCPACGTPVAAAQPVAPAYDQQPQNPYVQPAVPVAAPPAAPVDKGSIGWAILGFFFPIIGLILFFVWRNNKPNSAKKAIIGAAVGFVLNLIVMAMGGGGV